MLQSNTINEPSDKCFKTNGVLIYKVWLNLLNASGKAFQKSKVKVFTLCRCCYISPWYRVWPFIWTIWISLTIESFPTFWRRLFLKECISLFPYHLSLGKGVTLYLNRREARMLNLAEYDPVGREQCFRSHQCKFAIA